ncbi:MAG: DUF1844 domain-containing protein, partial [Deltaproteobacteria bacterium]|nr:DUF1844 domain-containing protein [Deltaproteobacteria bacterium]
FLEVARQTIDIICMLQQKTKGNLSVEEENLVQSLLYDLRMKYVEIVRGGGVSEKKEEKSETA